MQKLLSKKIQYSKLDMPETIMCNIVMSQNISHCASYMVIFMLIAAVKMINANDWIDLMAAPLLSSTLVLAGVALVELVILIVSMVLVVLVVLTVLMELVLVGFGSRIVVLMLTVTLPKKLHSHG